MDDNGNAYFYNNSTGETSWYPPASLNHLNLPSTNLSVTITVPESAEPGKSFIADVDGQTVEVMCPAFCSPGDEVELFSSEVQDETSAYGGEEVEYCDTASETTRELSVEEITSIALNSLAEEGGIDIYTIENDVIASTDVIDLLSQGNYTKDLLVQISWAYRLNLFEEALRDCVKNKRSLLDSSPYDNCNGIPRYANAGFIEWWEDLRSTREDLESQLEKGEVSTEPNLFYERHNADYSKLESLALSGDQASLLSGLIDRQRHVEGEIENIRARMLAVVSIESGPTRESLDNVHRYLEDSLKADAWDKDEMDEYVSNLIPDRHRFLVDLILEMVLLEQELETLLAQINSFTAGSRKMQSNNNLRDSMSDISSMAQEDSLDTEVVRSLIKEQEIEAQKLQDSLLADKEAKTQKLMERLAKRKLQFINELIKNGNI